ncbi:MAG: hypothetical protein Q9220_007213 [cf. Caloplaca sp. 1 TL-2023]
MDRYSNDILSIHSSGNQLLLRSDLHFNFDRLDWTIFPYSSNCAFCALDPSGEVASQFHRRQLRPIEGVQPAYLFAAFARAIFPHLIPFLRNRVDKYLIGTEVGSRQTGGVKVEGQWCFHNFHRPGYRGRSNSPTKRDARSKKTVAAESKELHDNSGQPPWLSSNLVYEARSFSDSDRLFSDTKQRRMRPSRHPACDGPCTCQNLPPSPSPFDSGRNQHVVTGRAFNRCLSDHCHTRQELDRFDVIRAERLAIERARSDPGGSWEKELAWAKNPGAVEDVQRWYWVKGLEVPDSDEEHRSTDEEVDDGTVQ